MKKKRQNAILDIINSKAVYTQDELLNLLVNKGFDTTQTTVSRDIKELGVEKVLSPDGRKKYAIKKTGSASPSSYMQVMASCIVSIDSAENIIVVKTASGMAMAVGAAIDAMNISGIVGCIAGDDTLFLAIKHNSMVDKIIGELKNATKYAY